MNFVEPHLGSGHFGFAGMCASYRNARPVTMLVGRLRLFPYGYRLLTELPRPYVGAVCRGVVVDRNFHRRGGHYP